MIIPIEVAVIFSEVTSAYNTRTNKTLTEREYLQLIVDRAVGNLVDEYNTIQAKTLLAQLANNPAEMSILKKRLKVK